MAESTTSRDIELRLRARDLSTAELKQVIGTVKELSGALDAQLVAATKLEVKERELRSTLAQFDQAAKNVSGLDAHIQRSKLLTEQLEINRAELKKSQDALAAFQAQMVSGAATGKNAETSLRGFEKAVAAAENRLKINQNTLAKHSELLEKAGVDTRDLIAAEKSLVETAGLIGDSRTKLSNTLQNYARIEREAKEAAKALEKAERDAAAAAKAEAEAHRVNAEALRNEVSAHLDAFNKRVEDNRARAKQQSDAHKEWLNRLEKFNAENLRKTVSANLEEFNKKHAANQQIKADREAFLKEVDRINAEAAARQKRRDEQATVDARKAINDLRRAREQEAAAAVRPTAVPGTPGQPRTDAMGRPGRGASGTPGFLGLRPYELTNLGYQVNDVISGLASGQNATQILAQQGGQFIQIFGTAALRWFPLVAVAATAMGVAIAAVTQHVRTLASNREFSALLMVNKQAIDLNAESLTKLRRELQDVGVSWADAGKAIRGAVSANVKPEFLRETLMTARAMARVNGVELPQAMTDLTEGISGSVKAFDDLSGKYPLIIGKQADYIRSLILTGKAAEAQIAILRLLSEAYKRADDVYLSPFEKATEKLGASWRKLLDTLGNSKAFDMLITKATEFVGWLTRGIEAIDRLLDKMKDPRFAAGMAQGAGLLPPGSVPSPGGGTGGITSWATGLGERAGKWIGSQFVQQPAAEAGLEARLSLGPRANIDSDALKRGYDILMEASKALPPGHRAIIESTNIRNSPLTASGTPSEHVVGGGRAFDVRIVDENNRPVPGYMGRGGAAYEVLDKAVEAIATARGTTAAIGTRFRDPDSGHYSFGGQEAINQAKREGRAFTMPDGSAGAATVPTGPSGGSGVTGPRGTDVADAKALVRAQEESLAIQRAASQTREEELIRAKALREIRETIKETGTEEEKAAARKLQTDYAENEVLKFREQTNVQVFNRELDRGKQLILDGKDRAAIEKAGQDARAAAIAKDITNWQQLQTIQDRGEAEERARLQRIRTETDAIDAAEKQIHERRSSINKQQKSQLEQLNIATNTYYDDQLKALDKLAEKTTQVDKTRIDGLKAANEANRANELSRNQRSAAEASANEALTTRRELINSYTKLEEAGEITIREKEKGIKEAYDLTRSSILAAADALQKYIDTSKDLKPEVIALLTAKVKELRAETKYIDPFWKGLKDTFQSSFASAGSTFFDNISEAIGGAIAKTKEWKDVWVSVKNAALNFFASILKSLAEYILKAQLAKLASELFGKSSGGIGDIFSKLLGLGSSATGAIAGPATGAAAELGSFSARGGAVLFHGGGVAGRDGVPTTRGGDESYWAGAPRYHTGTIVGLAPNEQRAILKRGEEVLTTESPRNILNGGGKQPDVYVRNVLVDDQRRVPEAMQGAHGEKVVLQHILRNGATIRDLVRG